MAARYTPDHVSDPEIWRSCSADLSELNLTEDILVTWSYYQHIYRFRRHLKGPYASLRWMPTKTILKFLLQENLYPHPCMLSRGTSVMANEAGSIRTNCTTR